MEIPTQRFQNPISGAQRDLIAVLCREHNVGPRELLDTVKEFLKKGSIDELTTEEANDLIACLKAYHDWCNKDHAQRSE